MGIKKIECGGDFRLVALAVTQRQRERAEALGPGDGQRDRGIEAARQQHHGRAFTDSADGGGHGVGPRPRIAAAHGTV